MNIFKWLGNLFAAGSGSNDRYLDLYVLSHRCNEPVAGKIDLYNELSSVSSDEGEYPYYGRKVLHTSGTNRCFAQVEIELRFDSNKQMVEHRVIGGRWLDLDEYEAEVIRFNTPPEEEIDEEDDDGVTTDADVISDDESIESELSQNNPGSDESESKPGKAS
ncbi:MAG: hypothetical protein AAF639_08010 [Chloroflexota bacterium]